MHALIENNAITALRRVCGHPAGSRLQGRRLRSVARYLPGRYRHRQRGGWVRTGGLWGCLMKLEDITTIEQAKALAFDCIQAIEQQQQNLRALQQRITQLNEEATND